MPKSGDLKSGDCLFDQAPNGNDLIRTLNDVLRDLHTISKFEIIVLMLQKCPRNRIANKKNSRSSSFKLKVGQISN